MHSSIAELLAALPAAAALSADDRAKLAAIGTVEDVPPGTTLFEEGQPSDVVWLVAAGRIGLSMRCPGHPETTMLTVGAGELLGWSALTREARRVATGRVVERATLVGFERDALLALCEQDHDIGYAFMRLAFVELAQRLHDTRLQLLDLFGERPCR
jgi:CRP-like cAMP-binding protein